MFKCINGLFLKSNLFGVVDAKLILLVESNEMFVYVFILSFLIQLVWIEEYLNLFLEIYSLSVLEFR